MKHSKRTLEKGGEHPNRICLEDCKTFGANCAAMYEKSHVSSRGQQEQPNVFRVFRDIRNEKHRRKKWLIGWSIEKIRFAQSLQLSVEVSAWSFKTEVICPIEASDSLLQKRSLVFRGS